LAAGGGESLAWAVDTTVLPWLDVGGAGNEAMGLVPASGTNIPGAVDGVSGFEAALTGIPPNLSCDPFGELAAEPLDGEGELNDASSTPPAEEPLVPFSPLAERIATDLQVSADDVSDGFGGASELSELEPLVGLVVPPGAEPAGGPPGWP
jgi:hypothetical protein